MNQGEANEIVERMLLATQKMRSNLLSTHPESYYEKNGFYKFVLGRKSIMANLIAAANRDIVPQSLYNLMYVAHEIEPGIAALADVLGLELPYPTLDWIETGWEK